MSHASLPIECCRSHATLHRIGHKRFRLGRNLHVITQRFTRRLFRTSRRSHGTSEPAHTKSGARMLCPAVLVPFTVNSAGRVSNTFMIPGPSICPVRLHRNRRGWTGRLKRNNGIDLVNREVSDRGWNAIEENSVVESTAQDRVDLAACDVEDGIERRCSGSKACGVECASRVLGRH